MDECCLLGAQINSKDKVIFETENFAVTPALGQMGIDGYLLICTKEHYIGICGMPPSLDEEFDELIAKTRKLIEENYSKEIVAFEHGPKLGCHKGGGCLDHAHLHVVPTKVDLLGYLNSFFTPVKIGDYSRLRDIQSKNESSYLFIETQGQSRYVFEVKDVALPSQYLRQMIAKEEGRKNWDWRQYPDWDTFYRTLKKLR